MFRYALTCSLLVSLPALAQISQGGQPVRWGQADADVPAVPVTTLLPLERDALIAQEQQEGSFKYGSQRPVAIDFLAQGAWEDLVDGRRVCRYTISSPGAVMLSVQFDRFHLAPGAELFLYNTDRTFFIGGFTSDNELPTGDFATQVIPGDETIIEYIAPANPSRSVDAVREDGSRLHVASITHGYRDIFHFGERGLLRDYNPGYQSAACHNNVICPVASAFQSEKRAVAMFLRPDGNGCTGFLVNNTQQNATPYFYVANHCYTANENQWVFYFNYESPTCVGDTGTSNHTITGATKLASDYFADFVLLQLSSTVPANYSPYYLGWDHSGAIPSNGTVIHHPLFDVKKITFDNNPSTSFAYLPYVGAPDSVRLWKCFWDSGIVEPVSSGSPLLDQNHRVVGHMNTGAQTCANASTVYTGCAKLFYAWDGSASNVRLRDWLDPNNNTTTLNGYDPFSSAGVKVKLRAFLEGPYASGSTMNGTLRTSGPVPLTEPYTGLAYPHVNGGGGEATTASVLAVSGSTAVEDWVVVELRDKNNSASVLATKSALLLRNGNIVSSADGSSDVNFTNMPADNYFIAVHHRNHLGIMTLTAQALTSTATLKDLSNGSIALFGGANATKTIGTKQCMYAGDALGDNTLKYTGAANDRDPILERIGGILPTNSVSGYYTEDTNLDGVVKYTGVSNDRDIILTNIGGVEPTATRSAQLP